MRILILFLCLLVCGGGPAFALDSATLEFAVAVPNPINAGEAVSLQAVAVNSGSEEWASETYYWEAEVYDIDKKYIGKTERLQGLTAVKPGEASAASLSFSLPPHFGGFYFFRVFFIRNQTRLAESSYTTFQVIERPIVVAPPPPRRAFGGSFLTSFQTPNLSDARAGQATTALNVVGKSGEGTYLLNSYNIHDSTSIWNPYIFLGSYQTSKGNVNAGDVSPTFSALSLGGQGIRGVEFNVEPAGNLWSATRWSLVAGRTNSGLTAGPGGINGRYERLVYGARSTVELLGGKVKTGLHFIYGTDNTASLSTDPTSSKYRGKTLKPQGNQIVGTSVQWKPLGKLQLDLDWAQSSFTENREAPQPAAGSALKLQAAYSFWRISLGGVFQRASPKFLSFGAPTTTSDRQTINLAAGWQPAAWGALNLSMSVLSDNLGGDPKKTTSVQRIVSVSPSLILPTATRLNAGWSRNAAQGTPQTTLNNESQSLSFGVSQMWKAQTLSIALQNTSFTDLNKIAHDLDTSTLGISLQLVILSRYRISAGNTGSKTKDLVDGHTRDTTSQSASIGFGITSKISGQVWGSHIVTKDNGTASKADVQSLTANTEFTWQFTPQLAGTLGASQASQADSVRNINTSNMGLSTRIALNF